MRTLKNYESKSRGTPEFPCTLYRVDRDHPAYFMPLHWHAEYEIIVVRAGHLDLTVDDATIPLERGDVAFLSDGALHSGVPQDDDCLYDCVVFSGDLMTRSILHEDMRGIFGHRLTVRGHLPLQGYPTVAATAARLCDHLFAMSSTGDRTNRTNRSKPGETLTAIGIFTEFFGELLGAEAVTEGYSEGNRYIKRLKHVLSYMEEHYAERITLDELADVAGVSPKYLCRTFEALTGETPIAYVTALRVESAMRMLRETDRSLPDIAMSCGFGDQSYFAKQFKRATGMTPGGYRKFGRNDRAT